MNDSLNFKNVYEHNLEAYRFQGNYFWLKSPLPSYEVQDYPSCVYTAKQILDQFKQYNGVYGKAYAIWFSNHVYVIFETQNDSDLPFNIPPYENYEEIPIVSDLRRYIGYSSLDVDENSDENEDISEWLDNQEWSRI